MPHMLSAAREAAIPVLPSLDQQWQLLSPLQESQAGVQEKQRARVSPGQYFNTFTPKISRLERSQTMESKATILSRNTHTHTLSLSLSKTPL